jgi:ribosomal protein S18 acetylase RimI-like enzyme
MTDPSAISVRRMRDHEERAVKTLAGRAFPPLGNVYFSPPPYALVAELDGRLVGAVVPKIFELPGKHQGEDYRGGVVLWLMTDPGVRGSGVGGRLIDGALKFFEERGCREVFACVEGFNTSSSNLFAARGFTIVSLGKQLIRYGLLGTLALWHRTYRLGGDVGHFLWSRPGTAKPESPGLQWWGGALVSALIFLFAGWWGAWIKGADLMTALGAVAAVVTLFGVREVAMRLAAYSQGVSVRHHAWDSAFPLSLVIALALGVFLPTPGSVYPRGSTWRYRDLVPKLGPIAFAGSSGVLTFAWAAWILLAFGGPPPEIAAWLRIAQAASLQLALFEVLLPFSLFASFNGRRVWDWDRTSWAVLAIAALGLLVAGSWPPDPQYKAPTILPPTP